MNKYRFTSFCIAWILSILFIHSATNIAMAAETTSPSTSKSLRQKEVKYVSGPDKAWFTSDDQIYHYFICEYDSKGQMILKKRLITGPDKTPFTQDDVVEEYEAYTLDENGNTTKTTLFDKPGNDNIWFSKDDVARYVENYELNTDKQKTKATRTASGNTIRVINYSYNDKGWNTGDSEYCAAGNDGTWSTKDDVLDKYHKYEFDSAGNILKSSEFHANHNGKGNDNTWFTDDDVVFAIKKHLYGTNGQLEKELKAIGCGPDGAWFTDDDVLQYYTLIYYTPARNR